VALSDLMLIWIHCVDVSSSDICERNEESTTMQDQSQGKKTGSMLPPVSPPDVSSHRPPSPVCEHGGPSEEIPVVDLSSDEEEIALPDTSRDEEFARRLFDDLNRGVLGPPDDNNIIILNGSYEEEEVCEEITVDAKSTPPSDVNSPAPFVSVANADDAPTKVQDDNSDGGDKVGSL
jgi:hypothetical protein